MRNKEVSLPLLMILGASVLLFRTVRLLFFEDGLIILALWTKILTIIEMIVDILCIFFSFEWLRKSEVKFKIVSFRLCEIATLFHGFRVLIYILGRIGPWKDFDKTPEFRLQGTTNTFWLYFAGILSVVGVIGVISIGRKLEWGSNEE